MSLSISDISFENSLLDNLSEKLNLVYKELLELKELSYVLENIKQSKPVVPLKYIVTDIPFTIKTQSCKLIFDEDYKDYIFVNEDYINRVFYSYFQNINKSVSAYLNQIMLMDGDYSPLPTEQYFLEVFFNKINLVVADSYLKYKPYEDIEERELVGSVSISEKFFSTEDVIDVSKYDVISNDGYEKIIKTESGNIAFFKEIMFGVLNVNSIEVVENSSYINISYITQNYVSVDDLYVNSDLILKDSVSNMESVANLKIDLIGTKANKKWSVPYLKKETNQNMIDKAIFDLTNNTISYSNTYEAVNYEELTQITNKLIDYILEKASGVCSGD